MELLRNPALAAHVIFGGSAKAVAFSMNRRYARGEGTVTLIKILGVHLNLSCIV